MQPVGATHVSVVQVLPSLQVTGFCTQPLEVLQLSRTHLLLLLQTIGTASHWPLLGLHVVFKHLLESSHKKGVLTQWPEVTSQESLVHMLLSLQFKGVYTHPPWATTHCAVKQGLGGHTTRGKEQPDAGAQVAFVHTSGGVQVIGVLTQPPVEEEHAEVWQASGGVQVIFVTAQPEVGVQTAFWHLSPVPQGRAAVEQPVTVLVQVLGKHKFPRLQVMGSCWQPTDGEQV